MVFVSLVLLSADSRRQLGQMNDAILRDMKYAATAVVQDIDEEYVTSENMDQNMARYHHLLGVNVILLNRDDTVVASGLNTLQAGDYLDMDRFRLLKSRDNLFLLSSANIHYSDVLNHWKQASFIYEAEMTNITPYRVFIVTDSSNYYPRIESIYLTTLQSLFIIIVASMIVAAPLSSKVVSPLLRLTRMTGSLPRLLFQKWEDGVAN
ncbi:hypothetical protein Q0F98_10710 [Paenibacillus amylolyticus]|nr:hypothetical protein Q0F98_10710 [Paenibacillus amylolyticus]